MILHRPFYFVSTYANAPIPTKQRPYAFWGLRALAFALHGWQRLHLAIAGKRFGGVGSGLSPKDALALGLKIDVKALP